MGERPKRQRTIAAFAMHARAVSEARRGPGRSVLFLAGLALPEASQCSKRKLKRGVWRLGGLHAVTGLEPLGVELLQYGLFREKHGRKSRGLQHWHHVLLGDAGVVLPNYLG